MSIEAGGRSPDTQQTDVVDALANPDMSGVERRRQISEQISTTREADEIRIESDMKEIKDELKEYVVTNNRESIEKTALEAIEAHFERELRAALTPAAQRYEHGDDTAREVLGGGEAESDYKKMDAAKDLALREIRKVAEGVEGRDRMLPSEFLRRLMFPRGYTSLLTPPENETAEQKAKRENVRNFLFHTLGMDLKSFGDPEKPGNRVIAGIIETELAKGDRGLMPFIWMALSSSSATQRRDMIGTYAEHVGKDEDKIGTFLRSGSERHVFSPRDIQLSMEERGIENLFTPEDMASFAEAWEGRREVLEELRGSAGMLPAVIKGWGFLVLLINGFTSMSKKGFRKGLTSLIENPFVYVGAGAMVGGEMLGRHRSGERPIRSAETADERDRAQREEGLRAIWASKNEFSPEIHEFISDESDTTFERGRLFYVYSQVAGEDASCQGFLEFLDNRIETNPENTELIARLEETKDAFKRKVGEDNIDNGVINAAIRAMVTGFRMFSDLEHARTRERYDEIVRAARAEEDIQ